MKDQSIRQELQGLTDDLCATPVVQIADALKSLHNRIYVDHARDLLSEAFPTAATAVLTRAWDETVPTLNCVFDADDDVIQPSREQSQACIEAERCLLYLGNDEELEEHMTKHEEPHGESVTFTLDLHVRTDDDLELT